MNTFFIEFRDPLFGVIVFFILLFVLSFFSYWWGRHKSAKGHRDLESFLGKFEALEDESRMREQVQSNALSNESWLMLAQSFEVQGNYEKSVEIYHALLTKNRESTFQRELLQRLGKSYFKAGFLERSRQTFLQILQNHPRSPQALHYLILIYEQLQQFDKALEVMESLLEITPDAIKEHHYLQCRQLLSNHSVGIDEKGSRLVEIYREHHHLGYLIFDWLFTYRPELAWKHFDQSLSARLSDILWRLRDENIDLDIISNNTYLRELFSAKGSVDLAQSSTVFELDVLIALRKCGVGRVSLQFEYSCNNCKQISFFPFHRCPHCHAIDSVDVIMNLSQDRHEENNSLQ